MTYAIVALLAVLVIAAVALPLFRGGRSSAHDAREFAAGPEVTTSPAAPVYADDPARVSHATGGDQALESEIARYREAVAAGTLCRRCGEANPRGARFCAECGKPLETSDAQEYA